jgi:4'-phosphopantetheinyl transferase
MTALTTAWPSASRASHNIIADEVHVWQASLEVLPQEQERLHRILDAEERSRADRFRFPKDRRHYTVARGVLRLLLARYLHTSPEALNFSYNQYGKPALIEDLNPNKLQFNLSHSGERVLYAFALQRELGIDIEWRDRHIGEMEQIAKRYFSPYETQQLLALPESQRVSGFFNCWTRKEAYIKARGRGLSLPLHEFDVTLKPVEPAQLLATRDDPTHASRWVMRELKPGRDYVAALAVEGDGWDLKCWQWE